MGYGTPSAAMKSMPFTPTSPNSSVTAVASRPATAASPGAAGVGGEHDRARYAGDALLQIAPARHTSARASPPSPSSAPSSVPSLPRRDPTAAARRVGFHEPSEPGRRAGRGEPHLRRREAARHERLRHAERIPHPSQDPRGIAPQRAAPGEGFDGTGVVLEARDVAHRVARDTARRPRRRAGAEPAGLARYHDGLRADAQVQVAKAVHGDDVVPRARGRFRETAGGDAGDEDARHVTTAPGAAAPAPAG